jgi:uncharacterized membrane protein YhaH (DUF805 family)
MEKALSGLSGRINGSTFFLLSLPAVVLGLVYKYSDNEFVFVFYMVALVIALLAGIPRAHDLGSSGWYVVGLLVPFVGLYFCIKRGTPTANKWGPSLNPVPEQAQKPDAELPVVG